MKILKSCLLIVSFLFAGICCFAQEVDLTKGNLAVLKGETTINFEFTYEKMAVGDFSKEADYIKKRTEELNAKEPGTGDKWAVEWAEQKKGYFGEKFILGFTKQNKMTANKEAKYTLIFNTKALEPGYQLGGPKRNAGVDGTVTLVETANRDKKLAVLYVERAPETMWRGAAFDAKSRIGDAYYMDGQKVGKFIEQAVK